MAQVVGGDGRAAGLTRRAPSYGKRAYAGSHRADSGRPQRPRPGDLDRIYAVRYAVPGGDLDPDGGGRSCWQVDLMPRLNAIGISKRPVGPVQILGRWRCGGSWG